MGRGRVLFDSKRQKRRWCGEWRSYKIQEARSQGGKQGIKCSNVHQQPLTNGDPTPFLPFPSFLFFVSFFFPSFPRRECDAAYKTCCVRTRAMPPTEEAVGPFQYLKATRDVGKKRFRLLASPPHPLFLPLNERNDDSPDIRTRRNKISRLVYIYIRVVTRIIDSINSNFHERKIQIQGGGLCRKYAKYTLLQDRLNYKSTKAKRGKKARRKIFGIFHVVFSTIKGEKRGGGKKGSNSRKAHIKRRVWKRWRGGAAVVLQTIHELARVASCHSRCSFPRLSTLFFPLNDNLLTRLSAFFSTATLPKADENRTRSPRLEIRILHFPPK